MAHDKRALRRTDTINLRGFPQCMFFKYATLHTKAEVLAAGFFNASRDQLTPGSIIEAVTDWGGAKEYVRLKILAAPPTGNVTVADVTGDTTPD